MTVTHDQAIQIAESKCTGAVPNVTQVAAPENPVAWLMTGDEFASRASLGSTSIQANYVWAVQFTGESRIATTTAAPGQTSYFVACAVDAHSGQVQVIVRPATPVVAPQEAAPYLPSATPVENLGRAIPATGTVQFTRQDVEALAAREFSGSGPYATNPGGYLSPAIVQFEPDRAQIELVRYAPCYRPPLPSVPPPTPTPTGTPPTAAPSTPASTPRLAPTPTTSVGTETPTPLPTCEIKEPPGSERLSWLVLIPSDLLLTRGCFAPINGFTCWSPEQYALIDAQTGELYQQNNAGVWGGPRVSWTGNEFRDLQHYAWAEGWWALWYQLKDYSNRHLPAGLAASLDRPDAPTPTPRPTPTISPNAMPTSTPTPFPTNTPKPPDK